MYGDHKGAVHCALETMFQIISDLHDEVREERGERERNERELRAMTTTPSSPLCELQLRRSQSL